MTRIKITQKRSVINRPPNQKATMIALGLRKINHSVEHDNNAQIAGMVRTVNHLVSVEEIK
jgi:large subunit ribosomal protein L30